MNLEEGQKAYEAWVKLREETCEKAKNFVRNGLPDWKGLHKFLETLQPGLEWVPLNTETGEIDTTNIRLTSPIAEIAWKAFFNHWMETANRQGADERGNFYRFYSEYNRNFESILTNLERARILILSVYTQYDGKPLEKNGELLTAKLIAKEWELSLRRTQLLLNKLVNIGVLDTVDRNDDKEQVYAFKENCIFMGASTTDKHFIQVYQRKLREIIHNVKRIEKRKSKQMKMIFETSAIGVLHALIPYFHRDTYYLVENPTESICKPGETVKEAFIRDSSSKRKKIKHLSKRKMSHISKIKKYDTLQMHLETLQSAGALMCISALSSTRTLIHPHLLFAVNGRGVDEYTEFVLAQWGQHESNPEE